MEFCAECGSLLAAKKVKASKKGLVCAKCGNKVRDSYRIMPSVVKVVNHSPKQLIAVIGEKEEKLNILPTTKMECPNCENNTAYVWLVQTRGSDESSTQFFRCTNCSHTFRETT